MASSGKQKTTMAKLAREAKLRERRIEKDARKQRRKEFGVDTPWQQPTDEAEQPIDAAQQLVDEAQQPVDAARKETDV